MRIIHYNKIGKSGWVFSFHVFFTRFRIAVMPQKYYGLHFSQYGISIYIYGHVLDMGFRRLDYLIWKVKRMANKDPELRKRLQSVIRRMNDCVA